MKKGTLAAAAAAAVIGLSATLVSDQVTATGAGPHQFLTKQIKFFRPFAHHHRHFNNGAFNNGAFNNGFYGGYAGTYYMPTYGTGAVNDETGSVRIDPVIMPPPALSCTHSREVVTVPSEADGSARQITITRC